VSASKVELQSFFTPEIFHVLIPGDASFNSSFTSSVIWFYVCTWFAHRFRTAQLCTSTGVGSRHPERPNW